VQPAVGARFPFLGQPGLQIERGPIYAHERPLGEEIQQLCRLIARDEPIERPGLGADGGDNLAAPGRRPGWRRPPGSGPQVQRERTESRPTDNDRNESSFYAQFLVTPASFLATPKTVQISAGCRATRSIAPRPRWSGQWPSLRLRLQARGAQRLSAINSLPIIGLQPV
jgi:hypothetical protein